MQQENAAVISLAAAEEPVRFPDSADTASEAAEIIAAQIMPERRPLRSFIEPHTYPAHRQPAASDISDIAPAVSGGIDSTYITAANSARNIPDTAIPHTDEKT